MTQNIEMASNFGSRLWRKDSAGGAWSTISAWTQDAVLVQGDGNYLFIVDSAAAPISNVIVRAYGIDQVTLNPPATALASEYSLYLYITGPTTAQLSGGLAFTITYTVYDGYPAISKRVLATGVWDETTYQDFAGYVSIPFTTKPIMQDTMWVELNYSKTVDGGGGAGVVFFKIDYMVLRIPDADATEIV